MNAKEMSAELARLNALTQSLNNQVLALLDRVTKLEGKGVKNTIPARKATFDLEATYKWVSPPPVSAPWSLKMYTVQKDSVGFSLKDATKVVEKLVKSKELGTRAPPADVAAGTLKWAFNHGMLAIVKPEAPAPVLQLEEGTKEVKIGEDGKAVVETTPVE